MADVISKSQVAQLGAIFGNFICKEILAKLIFEDKRQRQAKLFKRAMNVHYIDFGTDPAGSD